MLDRFHKFAEIVAAFAIVGSLIFVGIQMRQNTTALNMAASTSTIENWLHASEIIPANADLADIYYRGVVVGTLDDLTDTEQHRLFWFVNNGTKTMEMSYLNWLDGRLDPRLWQGQEKSFRDFVTSPTIKSIWHMAIRDNSSDEFVAYMDTIVPPQEIDQGS